MCPDSTILMQFVSGELEKSAVVPLELHLDECVQCRAQLSSALEARGETEIGAAGDPRVGILLGGRYRLRRKIGKGGTAVVYEARHELIGKSYAVKLLLEARASRTDVGERLQQEAILAAKIRHPGVLDPIDFGRAEDGSPFLVLELLQGRSLDDALSENGPFSSQESVEIAVQVASALSAAHRLGIVHRDVKPSNVFLLADGAVKVVDFGIATVLGESVHEDQRLIAGTPAFMAPEQFLEPAACDHRVDIYALGTLLYTLISGRNPFVAETVAETFARVRAAECPRLDHVAPISSDLAEVVAKAMSKEQADRFSDMDEMRGALRQLREGASAKSRFPAAPGAPPLRSTASVNERLDTLTETARSLEEKFANASGAERVRYAIDLAVVFQRLGRAQEAIALATLALDESSGVQDDELQALVFGRAAMIRLYAGDVHEAAGLFSQAERWIQTRVPSLRAQAAAWRAQLAGVVGDLGDRRNSYFAAAELYAELGDEPNAAGASVNLADALNRIGDYQEAEDRLRDAVDRCHAVGLRHMAGYGYANLALAHLCQAHWDEAQKAAEQALEIAHELGDVRLRLASVMYRARILLGKGETSLAIELARQCRADSNQAGFRELEASALITLAEAYLQRQSLVHARDAIETALGLRDELGGLEERDSALFAIGARVLEALDESERAAELRNKGRRAIEIIARRIADRDWRERFLYGVAENRELMTTNSS